MLSSIAHEIYRIGKEAPVDAFRHSRERRYGASVKTDFLDAEARDWLAGSMDLVPGAAKDEAGRLEAFRKHALVVRTCER